MTSYHFLAFLVGSLCNCILPEALKTTTVRHDSNFGEGESEKKRLRTAFSCLSSISVPQKEVSMSSLFLHSHYKGCLPPWELKRSRKGSMKERWRDLFCFSVRFMNHGERIIGFVSRSAKFSALICFWKSKLIGLCWFSFLLFSFSVSVV